MRPGLRLLLYGLIGWAAEIAWTAASDLGAAAAAGALRPALRLEGRTYLWMLPIYGLGGLLFERVARALRRWPWPLRGALYTLGIFAVEAATGALLRATIGVCPWDYRGARFSVAGLIRLDYAPLWFAFGMGLELLARWLEVRPQRVVAHQVR